ncbi:fibronectin type III domain-containing protein [Pseudoalteromonas rubra]|nr:fibronectin type III domain-containing protein [Pseudoalteromonas rubra]
MTSKLLPTCVSTLCIGSTLMFGQLATFSAQAATQSGHCEIARTAPGSPPMSWDNNDYVTEVKHSVFGAESCEAPNNATITKIHASFTAFANKQILTRGLLKGDYILKINASSPYLANPISGQVEATMDAYNANLLGSSTVNLPFEGVRLDNLSLNLTAQLKNSVSLRCANRNPAECEDYMYFEYTIGIDYEYDVPGVPDAPGWINASTSGNNVSVNWEPVSGATYKVAIQYNNNSWTDYQYVPSPASASYMSWQNLNDGNRRYQVVACNSYGCSEPSPISNTATVSSRLGTPNAPTASLSGNTVIVDWNDVPGAYQYVLSIKFNNNNWTDFRYFSAPNTSSISWSNLGSGKRQYRVKACTHSGICFNASPASNVVSN